MKKSAWARPAKKQHNKGGAGAKNKHRVGGGGNKPKVSGAAAKQAVLEIVKAAYEKQQQEKHQQEKQQKDIVDSDADSGDESDNDEKEDQSSDDENNEKKISSSVEDDDVEWEKFQQKINKREKLEGKSKLSHSAHCPTFPEDKQEYWWTYICDRKSRSLLTAPYHVTNLVDTEEIQLKFTAPRWPGVYTFSVCLRSGKFRILNFFRQLL